MYKNEKLTIDISDIDNIDNIDDASSVSDINTNVIIQNVSPQHSSDRSIMCMICLDDDTIELMHFTFFSFICNCNYHVHYSCLCDWIKKKHESSLIPKCLTCYKPISSYKYQYIPFKEIDISSQLITAANMTNSSISTLSSLTDIIRIVSNNMQDVLQYESLESSSLHNKSYHHSMIQLQNKILQSIFHNRIISRRFGRDSIEEIIERQFQQQRFLDRLVNHRERLQNNECINALSKLLMIIFIIIGVFFFFSTK